MSSNITLHIFPKAIVFSNTISHNFWLPSLAQFFWPSRWVRSIFFSWLLKNFYWHPLEDAVNKKPWVFFKTTLLSSLSSCLDFFEFPPQKQERKGGWEPSFASNLTLDFKVLIRPYWPGQVQSLIKDIELDLSYHNQNVRGRQGLKKCQSLILFTVRNIYERRHTTFIYPWVRV